MTENERPRRSRPTYGLPGATSPGASGPSSSGAGNSGHGAYGISDPSRGGAAGPSTSGPFGSSEPGGGAPSWPAAPGSGYGSASATWNDPSRPGTGRRGGKQILIGIGLLVLGAVVLVVGLVLGFRAVSEPIGDGAVAMEGGTTRVEAQSWQMFIVYVAPEDADTASCTAVGTSTGSVTVRDTSGSAPVGPGGETYDQKVGVLATQMTTVTVTCTGTTTEPLIMGPVAVFGMIVPMLIGVLGGGILGLVGLILLIVGIVRRVRSASGR